jgi:rhodanese-related sulfurtransferase
MATLIKHPIEKADPAKALEYFQDKMAFTTGPVGVWDWIREEAPIQVVDVRAAEDYNKGHVPGAVNLPKDRWDSLEGLMKDRNNILYCYSQTCHLAASAAVEFAGRGYSVMEMEGGFKSWQGHGFAEETSRHS